jgi:hypothetical protein
VKAAQPQKAAIREIQPYDFSKSGNNIIKRLPDETKA